MKSIRYSTALLCLVGAAAAAVAASHDSTDATPSRPGVLPGGRWEGRPSPAQEDTPAISPMDSAPERPRTTLSDLLGIDLAQADYEAVLDAAAAYADRQALRNIPPGHAAETAMAAAESVSSRRTDSAAALAAALLKNIFEWQELETDFTRDPAGKALRRSVALVQNQAKLDPACDETRLKRILETIETKGLFVPSSILFRRFILPYRPARIPAGCHALEIVAKPEFYDAEHEVRAVLDFLAPPGPICRVDFDTVGTAELRLERSSDGKAYTLAQQWTSTQRGGIRGPVLPDPPFRTRFLAITAIAPAETAVLRNVRTFALKEPAVTTCPRASGPPVLDADFKEPGWPATPQVEGFVSRENPVFAESQTTIRLFHDGKTLYIGGYQRDSRMATRVANHTTHDAPLWEDESIEVVFTVPHRPKYRFIVNALGAQFDAKDDDPSWDGKWQAATKDYPLGWAVEIALPFETFAAGPGPPDTCRANFTRTRRNVVTERSSWAYDPDLPDGAFGVVVFE